MKEEKKTKKFVSLNKQLLVYVLISSSILTTLITAMTLYLEYSSEIDDLNKNLVYIEKSTIKSLSNSLWTLDKVQTDIQMKGILTSKNIIQAYVKNENGEIAFEQTKDIKSYSDKNEKVFKLEFENQGIKVFLGYLHIVTTRDFIYQKMKSRLVSIFVGQGLKTLVISWILLLIFSHIVTRHIIDIDNFFESNKILAGNKRPRLKLNRITNKEDELDQLVNSINRVIKKSVLEYDRNIDLKDKAQKASMAKSQFLANMSHELRTPLNAILGMSEILLDAPIPDEYMKYVKIQYTSGNGLLTLINDILDFSKIEAGEMNLEKIHFSLFDVCENAIKMLETMAREKGNKIELIYDDKISKNYNGDPMRIGQIIINLLTNANKFTADGIITLRVEKHPENNDLIYFSVEDSGIGISYEQQEQIFRPFIQEHTSTTRKYGGTGIGLSICKHLVGFMGGEIWVESELGIGSKFHFTLKLDESNEEVVSQTSFIKVDYSTLTPCKILFAEDTHDNQQLIKAFLAKAPYEITFANDGQEAIDMYKSNEFDLIYMDIQMPIKNGYIAATEIRDYESNNNLKESLMIALTAYSSYDEIKMVQEVGFSDQLTKPIKKRDLIGNIEKHISVLKKQKDESAA